jgi:hypothetical protein
MFPQSCAAIPPFTALTAGGASKHLDPSSWDMGYVFLPTADFGSITTFSLGCIVSTATGIRRTVISKANKQIRRFSNLVSGFRFRRFYLQLSMPSLTDQFLF